YFGRNYALVVTQEQSISVTANIDAGMPWRTSYGDNIVYTDWRRDNFYYGLQEALKRQGISARRLGVEDDTLTLHVREQVQNAFPDASLIDVSRDMMRQRMIKSAEEIEVIKHGTRIGDIGGAAIKA